MTQSLDLVQDPLTTTASSRRPSRRSPRDSRPKTELVLVDQLVRRMRTLWPVRAVGCEVRSHGRCRTDACALLRPLGDPDTAPLLIGVEAKLTDWQRAVKQAVLNRYAVDASFVAVPAAIAAGGLIDAASQHGVGVLAVGESDLLVLLPAPVVTPDHALRARMLTQLRPVRARGRRPVGELIRAPGQREGWEIA